MGSKSAAYMRGYRAAAAGGAGNWSGAGGRTSQLAETLKDAGIPVRYTNGVITANNNKNGIEMSIYAIKGGGYRVSFFGGVASSRYANSYHSREYVRKFATADDVAKYLRKRTSRG